VATRSYYDSTYADGGAAALARAQETAHRALQLDPNLIEAATRLVIMRTEAGDIAHAVQDAKALVARRPDSSEAHATLGYALRYAGALGESASECNIALSIDGGNRGVRSCALTFEQLGDYDRSGVFAGVDAGSSWNRLHTGSILIKTGHLREALPLLTANQRRLVTAAAAHAPELDRLTDEVAEQIRSRTSDGEPFYFVAADLSAAGAPEQALRLLRLALQRNYCAVPAIDRDPALAAVRKLPEYAQFRAAAQQCRERVLGAIPLSAETTPPPPRR
jgi:tetratricopeptide (TPR) repeat protein